jgi:hypothetical protein
MKPVFKYFCCFHQKKKETEETTINPIQRSVSSFFHLDNKPREKEKSHCFIANPFHQEKQKQTHHTIMNTNEEKPKSGGFSWQDSVFIYFHPNLLLDKFLERYIEWKTDMIKKKFWYPCSLYVLGGIFFIGTTTYYYYYFNTKPGDS